MHPQLVRIFVALGVGALGTTLPWVRARGIDFSGQSLAGDWAMVTALVGAGMLFYWDRSGRIVPERLLIAKVAAGLALLVTLNDLWDIVRIDGAELLWGWWVAGAGLTVGFVMLLQLGRG